MIENFEKSFAYRRKIHDLIPGGAHTYSKGDDQFPQLAPAAIVRGEGAHVWDLDGNRYLDCSMGLTSVCLGHAYHPVLDRVRSELEKGVNFQRPSVIEGEMAEKFLSLLPPNQMIKFSKNGSTATSAAVKLARAFTGRKKIAFPQGHPFYSYDDWFIGKTACDLGVPSETASLSITFSHSNREDMQKLFDENPNQIAAVISEPLRSEESDVLSADDMIEICHRNGALFIQDEMITGFKVDFPGCLKRQKHVPDLVTWGKGISNGFSFCALTGKKEILELGGIRAKGRPKVFLISTTHGGETHAIAAGLATIEVFQKNDVIGHNHGLGQSLMEACQKMIAEKGLGPYLQVVGQAWMPVFLVRDQDRKPSLPFKTLLMQEMIKRGVLFQGIFIPSFSHTERDVAHFAESFSESLEVFARGLEVGWERLLVGDPVQPVFRRTL